MSLSLSLKTKLLATLTNKYLNSLSKVLLYIFKISLIKFLITIISSPLLSFSSLYIVSGIFLYSKIFLNKSKLVDLSIKMAKSLNVQSLYLQSGIYF